MRRLSTPVFPPKLQRAFALHRRPSFAYLLHGASLSTAAIACLLQRAAVLHVASFDATLRHMPLSTSCVGSSPQQAWRSAVPLSSRCVSTLCSRRVDPIAHCFIERRSPQTAFPAAASTSRADPMHAQYLDREVRPKAESRLFLMRGRSRTPVIAVQVEEQTADGAAEAAHLRSRRIASI